MVKRSNGVRQSTRPAQEAEADPDGSRPVAQCRVDGPPQSWSPQAIMSSSHRSTPVRRDHQQPRRKDRARARTANTQVHPAISASNRRPPPESRNATLLQHHRKGQSVQEVNDRPATTEAPEEHAQHRLRDLARAGTAPKADRARQTTSTAHEPSSVAPPRSMPSLPGTSDTAPAPHRSDALSIEQLYSEQQGEPQAATRRHTGRRRAGKPHEPSSAPATRSSLQPAGERASALISTDAQRGRRLPCSSPAEPSRSDCRSSTFAGTTPLHDSAAAEHSSRAFSRSANMRFAAHLLRSHSRAHRDRRTTSPPACHATRRQPYGGLHAPSAQAPHIGASKQPRHEVKPLGATSICREAMRESS